LKNTRYGDLSLGCHNRLEAKAGKASFTDTYTRMRGDDVGPTITTRCVSVSNGRFAHYDTDQNRGITPKEAALLQTFPNEYVFYPESGSEFVAVLIGNAVPPKLAKFFGRYIKEQMG
jgi:DNA (cytosine-5)-methyltransferase 1